MTSEQNPRKKLDKKSLQDIYYIFKYINPYKYWFLAGTICLFLSTFTALVFPYLIGKLIGVNEIDAKMNGLDQFIGVENLSLKTIVLALGILVLLQGLFSFLRVITMAVVSEKSTADMRNHLFDKIISLPIYYFEQNRVGDLTSKLTSDIVQIQETLNWSMAEMLRQIITLIGGLFAIFLISPKLSLIMISTMPILVIGAVILGKRLKVLSKKTQDELAGANVVAEEVFHNMIAVKSFTNEDFETKRYDHKMSQVVKYGLKAARFRGVFVAFFIFSLFGSITLVLWQGMKMVSAGTLDIGILTSFILFTIYIGASVGGLGDLYTRLQKTAGSSQRIRETLEQESETDFERRTDRLKLKGNISYQNVQFSYPSRKDVTVLKDITLEIQEGSKVALVGSSGAGKSTIVQLLMRLYDLNKGHITIDHKNINEYTLAELRSNIGIVPQEVMLFGGSIGENIAYGKTDASQEEIIAAAKKANAWEFIQSFPDGLNTIIGERGIKLSGGQRQRIAIARAILKDPAILILDEATSSLDSESEKLVQEALDELMKNRTSIIIAHRLSTIREADKIYVLENGRIVEEGHHTQLSNRSNGIYKNFLALQMQGESVEY